MILYYTLLYYTILYYTILYYTILYYTILYYTILYSILCYIILHCIVLYCIPNQATLPLALTQDLIVRALLTVSKCSEDLPGAILCTRHPDAKGAAGRATGAGGTSGLWFKECSFLPCYLTYGPPGT